MDCLFCQKSFTQNTKNHTFCNIGCRLKYKSAKNKGKYTKRNKKKYDELNSHTPQWSCPSCHKVKQLDFLPIKDKKKFEELECECGYKQKQDI